MPIKPFIYTLLFIGCMGQAFAQEKSLSVENILDIVRKYHPVIKQSFLQNEMAKNELRASRGIFDPSIQINTDEKTYDNKLYYKYNTSELKIPNPSTLPSSVDSHINCIPKHIPRNGLFIFLITSITFILRTVLKDRKEYFDYYGKK